MKKKILYICGGILAFCLVGIVIAFLFLNRISTRENNFEDAYRDGLTRCYRKHGFEIQGTGENLPKKIVNQCENEVKKELEVETSP